MDRLIFALLVLGIIMAAYLAIAVFIAICLPWLTRNPRNNLASHHSHRDGAETADVRGGEPGHGGGDRS